MSLKEFIEAFLAGFHELVDCPPIEEKPPEKKQNPKPPEKQEPAPPGFLESYRRWYGRTNAEYHRELCPVYGNIIFSYQSAFHDCFGPALNNVFRTVSNFRMVRSYPEVHTVFIAANTYILRPEYNRRDLPLREIVINDMRDCVVKFAHRKFELGDCRDWVVKNIWYMQNTVIIEVPYSVFPYRYPGDFQILAPDEYHKFCQALERNNQF